MGEKDSTSKGDLRGDLDPRLMHRQGMELSGLSALRALRGRRRASVEEDATGSKERARRLKDESRTATGRRESDSVDGGGDGTWIWRRVGVSLAVWSAYAQRCQHSGTYGSSKARYMVTVRRSRPGY